jgi:hypothetical protein
MFHADHSTDHVLPNPIQGSWEGFDGFMLSPENRRFVNGRKHHATFSVGSIFMLIIGICLIFAFGAVGVAYLQNAHFVTDGKIIQGIVTDRRSIQQGRGYVYTLTVQYQIPNYPATETLFSDYITYGYYLNHPIGTAISLKVLPESPSTIHLIGIENDGDRQSVYLDVMIGLALGAVLFIAVGFAPFLIERNMMLQGRLLFGELSSCKGYQTQGKPMEFRVRVEYTFRSPTSEKIIHGRQEESCDPIMGDALPTHPVLVAILYRDDEHFRML